MRIEDRNNVGGEQNVASRARRDLLQRFSHALERILGDGLSIRVP
jgi:hypothetical protein